MKRIEERDALDIAGKQQILHHVEHQQGLHPVIGEALPGFGEGEIAQPLGWPRESAVGMIGDGEEGVASAVVMGHDLFRQLKTSDR